MRLLYIVSHPIQYQAPLLRQIAAQPDLELMVLFERISVGGERDPGFSVPVQWDVPLLEGYEFDHLTGRSLWRELAACDAVWVHGWQSWRMKAVLLAAALMRRPVLMRAENWLGAMPEPDGWTGAVKRAYLRAIFAFCDRYLCIGSKNAQYYARFGIPSARMFSMPYAVDNDFFARRAAGVNPAEFRSRLGLPSGRPVVLFAGKLIRRKHPHTLLAAWRKAFPEPGARPVLVFVGDGELADLVRTGEEDVYFLGFRNQTEMPGLYAIADIFVLAAEREAWGLAINEAMACGTAVIASNECGAAYDLLDDTVGAVVQPGNIDELAAALRRVLPEARVMGDAARERIAVWNFPADLVGLRSAIRLTVGRKGWPA